MALSNQAFKFQKSGFTIAHMTEDERGAAAVEYAILAGLIVLAIVAAVTAIGSAISGNFEFLADTMSTVISQ
ncbi:Flp/Fap pilin component [Pseudovibrio axinellae]|uniref:Flp/Fap pilin component n=1 Tax=Pseudovibrio axinellae TaxID=989403 RepID=A0A165WIA1_9HYPH|nr:Flp family type IVb pilin [Pseudovibrio axinellae]KZL16554.1 Flp/Fap pilin component [Pseudovibrio axinellae]SEQ16053.1 pilus assembly protein Flp/PilA [Pseudovibrio axinellae]